MCAVKYVAQERNWPEEMWLEDWRNAVRDQTHGVNTDCGV